MVIGLNEGELESEVQLNIDDMKLNSHNNRFKLPAPSDEKGCTSGHFHLDNYI